jgi:phosphoribosylformimino-5-aminoimidazole carboxamide ribotide isomerase
LEIYPAVDLYGGKVVRLTGGRFQDATVYPTSPGEMALLFAQAGVRWAHVVDLEGAKTGRPVHLWALEAFAGAGLKVQFGGGIRSIQSVRDALSAGATRVMMGSALFDRSVDVMEAHRLFGPAILPAVDHRGWRVSVKGWTQGTDIPVDRALENLSRVGFSLFLVTDGDRDGTLSGPDLEGYRKICARYGIIAAGGIGELGHLRGLRDAGAAGAVLGKALYEGAISIEEAMRL